MKVAFPGIAGAFSHEACLKLLPEHEAVGMPSFEAVIDAVESGAASLGLLPIANNEAGETGARELIDRSQLHIVDQTDLPVRMHLLGLEGSSLDQIRTVVSHRIALRQCAASLAALGVATEEMSNTAVAARDLINPNRGVLGSEAAASLYGLKILKRDMHDRPDNATRFAILARSNS